MRPAPMLAIVALLLVVPACGGGPGDASDPATPTDRSPVGAWVLVEGDGLGIPDGSRATLTVGADGAAHGDTPCNGFGGEATWDDAGSFGLGDLAVTEMGCDQPRTDAQVAYLGLLTAADGWSRTGDRLELDGPAGRLVYRRVPPVESAALVGTSWVVDGFVEGDAVLSTTAGVDRAVLRLDGDDLGGSFTLTTGCRDFAGEWIADGDTIRLPSWGQAPGSVDVEACSADARAQEDRVLAVLEGGVVAAVDGDRLALRAADDSRRALALRAEDGADEVG